MKTALKNSIIFLIRFYRNILSPLKLQSCRFYPTCSEYALESVQTHGLVKGMLRSILRIIKCNPLSGGGYDPV